jgi:flagellar basal-body rod protein FlgB
MANKIADFMFEKTGASRLGKFLDVSAFRHKLISGNIANASTPGYRSRDINFHEEFKRVSGNPSHLEGVTTHEGHLPLGSHAQKPPDVDETRVPDGEMNAVDADREISHLAQNELIYTIGARLLKNKYANLRQAIKSE